MSVIATLLSVTGPRGKQCGVGCSLEYCPLRWGFVLRRHDGTSRSSLRRKRIGVDQEWPVDSELAKHRDW